MYIILFFIDVKLWWSFSCREQDDGSRIVYYVHEYDPLLDSSNMTFDDYVQMATDIQVSRLCHSNPNETVDDALITAKR